MGESLGVNDVNDAYKISDVARIFDIPASTLRFWERKGLVEFERVPMSSYRKFSFKSLADLADVAFARSVDMPIAEVRNMREKSPDELQRLLDRLEEEAIDKIVQLGQVVEEIHRRQMPFKTWKMIKSQPIHRVSAKLPIVCEFDFANEEMVRQYLADPSQAVDIISSEDPSTYRYGRFTEQSQWDVVRPADKDARSYLYGGLWMAMDRTTNVREFWDEADRLGLEHGDAICRYLFAADWEDKGYCYFFEAWLEVL